MIAVEKRVGQIVPLSQVLRATAECPQLDAAIASTAAALGAPPHSRAQLLLADLDQGAWYKLTNRERAARLADYAAAEILHLIKSN